VVYGTPYILSTSVTLKSVLGCIYYRNVQTAKFVARICRRRTERKIEVVNGEDHFEFRIGKVTGDEIGMLKIISERTWDTVEEFFACFVER
jgi:hypothetical protein